jgi:hypothetical protein
MTLSMITVSTGRFLFINSDREVDSNGVALRTEQLQIDGTQASIIFHCTRSVAKAACLYNVMMKVSVTSGAMGYKIFLAVVTQMAQKLNMMNLQFARYSTILASPVVSF